MRRRVDAIKLAVFVAVVADVIVTSVQVVIVAAMPGVIYGGTGGTSGGRARKGMINGATM